MTQEKIPCNKPESSHRKIASYLAAASATMVQTTSTHVFDTVTKRLQNNNSVKLSAQKPQVFFANLNKIIYPTATSSVWNGYAAALSHRLVASTLTFGSQPLIQDFLDKNYSDTISKVTGEKYKSTATHMLSGSIFGIVEVAFLPLDRWKVLRQTHNTAPFLQLINQPIGTLYAGSFITGVRNIKSFTTLYGMSSIVNDYFQQDGKQGSVSQRLIASSIGAAAAVIISNPADVIKTRIQAQTRELNGKKPDGAITAAAQIYKQHGGHAFWRGICPRLGSLVPRLTLLKSLSEELTPIIYNMISHDRTSP